MAVLMFPLASSEDLCAACRRATWEHRVNGRWIGCRVDVVVGQDQETFARRLRLARLQSRVRTVRPFGIDVEGL